MVLRMSYQLTSTTCSGVFHPPSAAAVHTRFVGLTMTLRGPFNCHFLMIGSLCITPITSAGLFLAITTITSAFSTRSIF